MSKVLEELERLKNLSLLEALKELRQNNKDDSHLFDEYLFDIIEPALKTLEIIKEKRVDIGVFRFCESADDYNRSIRINENGLIQYKELTQEEFYLVKEYLNEKIIIGSGKKAYRTKKKKDFI